MVHLFPEVDISTVIQIIRKSGKSPRTSGKWISTPTIIVVHHGSCRITVYRIPFKNSTAEAQNIQRKTTGSRTIIHICETSNSHGFAARQFHRFRPLFKNIGFI